MKFIHLADLHLGKMLHAYSLLPIQEELLQQVIHYVETHRIEAIVIAGDVYDKAIPSQEAVNLLNDFLSTLVLKLHKKVYMISGNHDSSDRLNFASSILESQGLYIETKVPSKLKFVEQEDVRFYFLPFIKPSGLKHQDEKTPTGNYQEAFAYYMSQQSIDPHYKNILITHQFVGHHSQVSESELTLSVGGTEVLDPELFKDFDYVALGHLHAPQYVGKETIRYSGSLAKYSFDEVHQKKSFVVVETQDMSYELVDLQPSQDVVILRGLFNDINDLHFTTAKNDLIAIELEDTHIIPHAIEILRQLYPHVLRITYTHSGEGQEQPLHSLKSLKSMDTFDLYQEFYQQILQRGLEEKEQEIIKQLLEETAHEAY